MKTTATLKSYNNIKCTSIKHVLEFDESLLEKRKQEFYRFEKNLLTLKNEELEKWISIFNMNIETTIMINNELNSLVYNLEKKNKKAHYKGKLAFILNRCMELAHIRTFRDPYKDRGRVVSTYVMEDNVVPTPINSKKSRRELLKLR